MDDIRRKLEQHAKDWPDMPDDFWPEQLVISVKYLGFELACPIKKVERDQIPQVVYGLRLSMWSAAHHFNDDGSPMGDEHLGIKRDGDHG